MLTHYRLSQNGRTMSQLPEADGASDDSVGKAAPQSSSEMKTKLLKANRTHRQGELEIHNDVVWDSDGTSLEDRSQTRQQGFLA